jgi:hypothetical protein
MTKQKTNQLVNKERLKVEMHKLTKKLQKGENNV